MAGFLGYIASKVAIRVNLFNTDLPGAGTSLFSAISPLNPVSMFRISFVAAASGKLTVVRTVGATSVEATLASNADITADTEQVFDIFAVSGESIALKYSGTSAKLKRLIITEQAGGM